VTRSTRKHQNCLDLDPINHQKLNAAPIVTDPRLLSLPAAGGGLRLPEFTPATLCRHQTSHNHLIWPKIESTTVDRSLSHQIEHMKSKIGVGSSVVTLSAGKQRVIRGRFPESRCWSAGNTTIADLSHGEAEPPTLSTIVAEE
jgi:hypothetical protein